MEGFNFNEFVTAGTMALGGIALLGLLISQYTKTPKDDAFFERLAKALNLK